MLKGLVLALPSLRVGISRPAQYMHRLAEKYEHTERTNCDDESAVASSQFISILLHGMKAIYIFLTVSCLPKVKVPGGLISLSSS